MKGITVTGHSQAVGPRDQCSITVGAEVRAANAPDALAGSAEALDRMRSTLLAGGIPASALSTSAVSLNPVYESYPTVAGFSASVDLTATTTDLDQVGQLLTSVVVAGGDAARLNQVSYTHSDSSALAAAARDAAWADALARATQLAELSGRSLGDVIGIVETGTPTPGPRGPMRMAAMAAEAVSVPVDAGESAVSVALTVRWSLR